MNNPSEQTSSSSPSSSDPHTAYLVDRLKIEEEEAARLLQKIKDEAPNPIKTMERYLKAITEVDYHDKLTQLRQAVQAPKGNGRKPWCGRCDETTRTFTRTKVDGTPVVNPCPICSRYAANTDDLAAALERRDRARRSPAHFMNYDDQDKAYAGYEESDPGGGTP